MANIKQPYNTESIICYYDDKHLLLQQNWNHLKYNSLQIQYLLIDRLSQNIAVVNSTHPIFKDQPQMSHKSFSALLGILTLQGYNFLLFCEEAKISCCVEFIEAFQISSLFFLSFVNERQLKHKKQKKVIYSKIREYYTLLKTGFYYSYKYNLTQPFQNQNLTSNLQNGNHFEGNHNQNISTNFAWNKTMLKELSQLTCKEQWKCPIIQGFVRHFDVFLEGNKVSYVLLSRRSTKKGGTRYFDRGLNDDGYVANFVETEQIIKLDEYYISDLQIRGNIPIFFEQVGFTTRIKINRGYELTHEIYSKHMQKCLNKYKRVFFVNLLSMGKNGEKTLITELESHIKSHSEANQYEQNGNQSNEKEIKDNVKERLKYLYYDFHLHVKGGHYDKVDLIINQIREVKSTFTYCIYDSKREKMLSLPHGTFRTNCLDCLDRTNFFQAKLALITLEEVLRKFNVTNRNLLEEMKEANEENQFIKKFRNIWADNGDCISFHYTGTGSTHTDITRDGRRGWLGNIKHKYKTVTRFYNQNFWDFYKMKLIDLILNQQREKDGLTLSKEIKDRETEFITKQNIQIYLFTWKSPKKTPKSLIFFPNEPDILAISVQESTDDEQWSKIILEAVDKERYILISEKTSNNNVLKVFAKKEHKFRISMVETSRIKFKSYFNKVLSSKCAISIRFSIDQTKINFIGCQLEYGKEFLANRIKNLHDIHLYAYQEEDVGQQKSQNIASDDVVFLFGNMNTCLQKSMPIATKSLFQRCSGTLKKGETISNEEKGSLIKKLKEYDTEPEQIYESLLEYRQYEEEEITFIPTYKYLQNYNATNAPGFDPEISGWPDRIFFSSENKIVCQKYDVIEEMRNEHVPVIGYFQVEVQKVNEEVKVKVCTEILEKANSNEMEKELIKKENDNESVSWSYNEEEELEEQKLNAEMRAYMK